MRLWQSNIGKAWQVLKRDGLWRGGQRIFDGFCNLIPRRLSGDILIVSSGVGDSARYRGAHVAEELRQRGFRVAVTTQYNPLLARYADRFSVFVFHRTLYDGRVKALFDRAKSFGKTLVFETDDLVFDPVFVQQMDFYRSMNALEKKLYEHGVGGEILADPAVEAATTTTDYLAEKLRAKGKRVFIVKNKLSEEDVRWANEIISTCHFDRSEGIQESFDDTRDDPSVRIGYASGTATHNKDFATITEALLRLLAAYPQTTLVIAGPLLLDERFAPFAERIERLPFANRREHFRNLASLDINLAPLEIGEPFCEGKSELKFFEAGIVAVPTVAAATGSFVGAIDDGIDGFVARDTEEWYVKLDRLVKDSTLRVSMGQAARAKVLREYVTARGTNDEYYQYLRQHIHEQ